MTGDGADRPGAQAPIDPPGSRSPSDPARPRSPFPRLLGEFVTIVLGVLVALAVDEWRDQRADDRLEVEYYESLVDDLERDIAEYEFARDFIGVSIEAAQQVLAGIEGVPASEPYPTMVQAVQYASWVNYPAWSSGTLDELVNSGAIRLLRDPDVKRAVLAYYDAVSEWKPRLQGPEFSAFIAYRRATAGLASAEPSLWTNERIAIPADEFATLDPVVRDEIRGNTELRGLTREMIWQWSGLDRFMQSFHDQAVELRDVILAHVAS